MASKSKPGVCDVCGHAVMRSPVRTETGERNGHKYEKGRLVQVLCWEHGGRAFEDSPGEAPARDWFGNLLDEPRVIAGKE